MKMTTLILLLQNSLIHTYSALPRHHWILTCLVASSAPSRWGAAMALYMIGFISYGATLVFYAAVFPRLARNTAHARTLRDKYEKGEIPLEEYELEESMETNRISNISTVSARYHGLYDQAKMLTFASNVDAQ